MKTVTVTGGEVVIREKADIRVRDRQRLQSAMVDIAPMLSTLPVDANDELDIEKALADGLLGAKEMDALYEFTKTAVVVRIVSWTLPGAPPKTIDDVDDLAASLYDELSPHVAGDIMDLVGDVDFSPSDPRAEGFKETPTPPLSV